MQAQPFTRHLCLILVIVLIGISAAHLVLDDHAERLGAGDRCCSLLCTSIALNLIVLIPSLFGLNRSIALSDPLLLAARRLHVDPPPRRFLATVHLS